MNVKFLKQISLLINCCHGHPIPPPPQKKKEEEEVY